MKAEIGSESYGILSNKFLAEAARCIRYEVTVDIGDGVFSYAETTSIEHGRWDELLLHTDRNTLHRIDEVGTGQPGEVSTPSQD